MGMEDGQFMTSNILQSINNIGNKHGLFWSNQCFQKIKITFLNRKAIELTGAFLQSSSLLEAVACYEAVRQQKEHTFYLRLKRLKRGVIGSTEAQGLVQQNNFTSVLLHPPKHW